MFLRCLTDHLAAGNEFVALIAPRNLISSEAATPDKETQQVAQWINPAQPERVAVAENSPADRHGLEYPVEICPAEQYKAQLPVVKSGCGYQPHEPERHCIREACTDVPRLPGESRASHPANLVSQGRSGGCVRRHVLDEMVG